MLLLDILLRSGEFGRLTSPLIVASCSSISTNRICCFVKSGALALTGGRDPLATTSISTAASISCSVICGDDSIKPGKRVRERVSLLVDDASGFEAMAADEDDEEDARYFDGAGTIDAANRLASGESG